MSFIGGYYIIPVEKERINIVLGKRGKTKKILEENFNVKITVDKDKGEVKIESIPGKTTPLQLLKAREAIIALVNGASIKQVLRLADEDTYMTIINLKQYTSGERKDIERVAGRIIGEKGKAKKMIEELTGADIIVHDYNVIIIGKQEQLEMARTAVIMLIQGRQHKTVYRYLQRKRRELKYRKLKTLLTHTYEEEFKI